jgi:hypothetical protein
MLKKTLFMALGALLSFGASAQFLRLQVDEVSNSGLVPGKTYRVYAVMMNENDLIDAVFADQHNAIEIKSTKPFYQHPMGGALSVDVQRFDAQNDPTLLYDSWFTIGLEDNYRNYVMPFQVDSVQFKKFEQGQDFFTDGSAWFVTPDKRQVRADKNGRILLMQLTTEGKVTGKINIHGRTRAIAGPDGEVAEGGELIEVRGIEFTCP